MSEGFQFLDIILFAMVAVFLALRLRSVLGKRTGHQRHRPDPMSQGRSPTSVDAGQEERDDRELNSSRDAFGPEPDAADLEPDDELRATLTKISIADPSFDGESFLEGACTAFEMVVNAFAEGDLNTLRDMLADDVFNNFADAIEHRREAGEQLNTKIVGIESARIIGAELVGNDAVVTVSFVSRQNNVTRDRENRIVGGDPHEVIEITDIWSFGRDTQSGNPNWTLVETGSQT